MRAKRSPTETREALVGEAAPIDRQRLCLAVLDFGRRPRVAGEAHGLFAEGDARSLAARSHGGEPAVAPDEPDAAANFDVITVRRQRL